MKKLEIWQELCDTETQSEQGLLEKTGTNLFA